MHVFHHKHLNFAFGHTDYNSCFVCIELMFVHKWEMMVIFVLVFVEDKYALFCVYKCL